MAGSSKPDGQKQVLSRRMAKMFPFDELYDAATKNAVGVGKNEYHPLTNPTGIINMSTAFSYICEDLLMAKFADPDLCAGNVNAKVWHVTTSYGSVELRQAFASFYTRKLKPAQPILADDLIVVNGVTSCIDYLAHCIADPGDVILIPTPSYAYMQRNVRLRAEVDFWPVDLFREDEAVPFQLTAKKVEAAIKNAINSGKNVRGLIIVNPNNPSGDVYSPQLITSILEICKSYSIHVILDEISVLTVFEEGVSFESCVSYPKIPDPQRTHVVWSISKDFSFDGCRIALVYTRSKEVSTSLVNLSFFFMSPTFQQFICKRLIEDESKAGDGLAVHKPKLLSLHFMPFVKFVKLTLLVADRLSAFEKLLRTGQAKIRKFWGESSTGVQRLCRHGQLRRNLAGKDFRRRKSNLPNHLRSWSFNNPLPPHALLSARMVSDCFRRSGGGHFNSDGKDPGGHRKLPDHVAVRTKGGRGRFLKPPVREIKSYCRYKVF